MELEFDNRGIAFLELCLRENRCDEQTLELRLPEGMPDVGRVLSAWGQPILRSKEWHADRISVTCGMRVWVLYLPEQEEAPRCLEGWVSHSLSWDLPPDCPEGSVRVDLLTRFVDARVISARKILVRSGLSAEAEGWISREASVPVAEKVPEEVQLLKKQYPLRLVREAGEKAFQLSQKLTLPSSVPVPDKLLSCLLTAGVTEAKLVVNKLVFRGSCNLRVLYLSEEGQLHSWVFPLPFSQYAPLELTGRDGSSGQLKLCVTALEVEKDPDGAVEVKCGITAQYLILDQEVVETVEDAYVPGRAVQLEQRQLSIPAVLDTWEHTLEVERSLSLQLEAVTDAWITVDRPRQRLSADRIRLEVPGQLQLTGSGPKGLPAGGTGRFEGTVPVDAAPDCRLLVELGEIPEPQLLLGGDAVEARIRIPLQITAMAPAELQTLQRISLGEPLLPDREGPSLVIRPAGSGSLWDIAKESGSTVEAIRKANGLEGDPAPGQLLLIPLR